MYETIVNVQMVIQFSIFLKFDARPWFSQVHGFGRFTHWENRRLPIEQKARWAHELVWSFWREKLFAPGGKQSMIHHSSSQ